MQNMRLWILAGVLASIAGSASAGPIGVEMRAIDDRTAEVRLVHTEKGTQDVNQIELAFRWQPTAACVTTAVQIPYGTGGFPYIVPNWDLCDGEALWWWLAEPGGKQLVVPEDGVTVARIVFLSPHIALHFVPELSTGHETSIQTVDGTELWDGHEVSVTLEAQNTEAALVWWFGGIGAVVVGISWLLADRRAKAIVSADRKVRWLGI